MKEAKEIFKTIIDNTKLSDKHRSELKTKRGFTDEVIDKMKFRSSGPHLTQQDWVKPLPEAFKKSLKFDNILIPYLNIDDTPYHLRPHKFGFEGMGVQVYVPYHYMGDKVKRLVLAESEFKALASCLMGVPAIGVPGISSFSGKKFDNLTELINSIGVGEVIICFDREIKGDKNLPNFKEDFTDRYDTEFYSYVMAEKLSRKEIPARVAVLDETWMEGGKIDIDGYLASGRNHELYQRCIAKALPPMDYRTSMKIPLAHKGYLERRIDKYFYDGPLKEKNNCYVFNVKGKEETISNFTIKIHHTVYDNENKAERLCKFYSKYGNTATAVLSADMMVSRMAFQKFCYERGDLEYHGSDVQLQEIWKWVFMNQEGVGIKRLYTWGYDAEVDAWFFSNGAYKNDEFYPVDEDGIVWIGDEGYSLPEYSVDDFAPPSLDNDNSLNEVSIASIFSHMRKIMKPEHARLLLGWTLGNFFLADILIKFKVYPFLFMHGKMGSGKSTYANICSSFFGFKINGVSFSSTPVGIITASQKLCGPPIWIDEFRNSDPRIAEKINILRSIYDRSTRIKGSKKNGEIKAASSRATLIISGEEHPKDAAFNSRCIQLPIHRSDEENKGNDSFQWIMKNRSLFNSVGHWVLSNKVELWNKISERISDYFQSFDANEITLTDRSRIHYSIIGSVADVIIGEDAEFSVLLAEKALSHDKDVYNDQAFNVFCNDLLNMQLAGRITAKIITAVKSKDTVSFSFSTAYALWEHFYKGMRNDIPASKSALTDYIKRESYFLGYKRARMGNVTIRCMSFDRMHPKFPESLKILLNSQERMKGNDMNDNYEVDDDMEDGDGTDDDAQSIQ